MAGLHPKVGGGALAGAVVALVAGELARRGIRLEPDEASALTVILTAIAGWLIPNGDAPPGPPDPPQIAAGP